MPARSGYSRSRTGRQPRPLEPASVRLLVAGAVGVMICVIWLTGTVGDSHRVTMLALSAVSILGLGLVLELRKRCVIEIALRHAKEEADRANRAKSEFLATMSHELRTPLNAISGFAEIMHSQIVSPDDLRYRSYAGDIHTSAMHLQQLINDLLDLTKAEAGKLELCEDNIDVAELVRSVVRLSSTIVANAGLTVDIEAPPDLPLLRADERRTRQVLFNLIGNAVKYTPADGHIAISCRVEPGAGLEVVVADNGIGIAAADLDRVLEPFVQVDSALSRQRVGSGLGLPLVRAVMELHGGRLELSSVLGAGTKAAITFPAERIIAGPSPTPALSAA